MAGHRRQDRRRTHREPCPRERPRRTALRPRFERYFVYIGLAYVGAGGALNLRLRPTRKMSPVKLTVSLTPCTTSNTAACPRSTWRYSNLTDQFWAINASIPAPAVH